MKLYCKIDLFNKKTLIQCLVLLTYFEKDPPKARNFRKKMSPIANHVWEKYGEAGPIQWRGGKGTCKKKSHGRVPSLNTCACRLYYVYYLFYKSQTYCRDDQG